VAKISQEFKIGALMIAGASLLLVGINYLQGFNPFKNANRYYAHYEKIDGLAISNPVLVNGYKIGQVSDVAFDERGDGSLIVAVDIEQDNLALSKDTKARIFSSDLFGTKAIELMAGESNTIAVPGDTLLSEIEVGIAEAVRIELMPLKNKTDQLIDGVDDILENLKAVFEADATLGLPKAFESLQRTVEQLEQTSISLDGMVDENRATLNKIFRNVEAITENLEEHNDEMGNVITNFSNISDSLASVNFAATMSKADRALSAFAEVAEKVNSGEGTLGQLVHSDTLHSHLMATNDELQYLLNDLYLNPWRYVKISVFGKKDEKRLSKKETERLRKLIDEQLEANQ
jgi:phospholipid/cholesterol/gamma-HCH transport system substrate-binding protein